MINNFTNIYPIENLKYVKTQQETIDVTKLNVPQEYIDGMRLKEVPKEFIDSEEETIDNINEYCRIRETEKR